MLLAHFPDDGPVRWHNPVLALGNFDGLHRGHMKIIDRVRRRAGERGGTPAAMTFDPHPSRVLRPDKAPPLLMTKDQKIEALDALRHAGRRRRALYARAVAMGSRDVRAHTCSSNGCTSSKSGSARIFCSGTSARATFSVLRSLGARYGFRAEKIDPVRYKDFVVSSTRVRRLLAEGRVDEAGALLGHHYFIDGTRRAWRRTRARARVSDREPDDRATSWCRRAASTPRR